MKSIELMFTDKILDIGERITRELSTVYSNINSVMDSDILVVKGLGEYYLYPYFFVDDFQIQDEEAFYDICKAGAIYFDLVLINDDLYDGITKEESNELIFAKDFLCAESIKILSKHFSADSLFWKYFNKYNHEFIVANKLEKSKKEYESYSYDEFMKIARGKSAIAKISVAALGCLSGNLEKIDEFEETQGLVAQAAQLFDDLRDWKEDLAIGQASYMLNKIREEHNFNAEDTVDSIRSFLFKEGYLEFILCSIRKLCSKALLFSGKTESWQIRIRLLQERVEHLQRDMLVIKDKEDTLEELYLVEENPAEVLSDKIREMLQSQKENGFLEIKHRMLFRHEEGFNGTKEYLDGDVFQRAYMFNLFSHIQKVSKGELGLSIESEVETLLKHKPGYYDYGWSYFPELPELCPDIDTLSEIIKITKNYEHSENVEQEINDTLEIVMQTKEKDSQAFRTWILPKYDENKIIAKARKMAQNFWGMDYDIEVNINFLLALAIWDRTKYDSIIQDGLKWIECNIMQDKCLSSTWYCSNYYSYYLLSKLFREISYTRQDMISKIVKFIMDTQNEDGSWGNGKCNIMDSAYAVSAICILAKKDNVYKETVQKALEFIEKNYVTDGYWYGEYFIKMNIGRVTGNDKIFTYQSSLITTVTTWLGYLLGKEFLEDDKYGDF